MSIIDQPDDTGDEFGAAAIAEVRAKVRRPRKARPPVDPELATLTAIVTALDALPDDARFRVAKYVMNRVMDGREDSADPGGDRRTSVTVELSPSADGTQSSACARVAPTLAATDGPKLRLPAEWLADAQAKRGLTILDNDGWTSAEWGIPCTEEDFNRRLMRCTISRPAPTAATVPPPAGVVGPLKPGQLFNELPEVGHFPQDDAVLPPVNPFLRPGSLPGFPTLPPPPARGSAGNSDGAK